MLLGLPEHFLIETNNVLSGEILVEITNTINEKFFKFSLKESPENGVCWYINFQEKSIDAESFDEIKELIEEQLT